MDDQIKLVIIDDGVNEKLYNAGSLWLDLEITKDLQIKQRIDYSPYEPSHGTTCGAIIKKYSPNAVLGSIKVLNDDSRRGIRDQLVTALFWCADNAVKLANLSIGSIDFRDHEVIRKAVNYAVHKGAIIVAACNNKYIYTHPASLSNVIGVKCDVSERQKEGQYYYNHSPLDGIDITACSKHLLSKYNGDEKITSSCNSFAAPMITALSYNILKQNPSISLEEMKHKLAAGAVNDLPDKWSANMQQRVDWIESALVFDINCSHKPKVKIPYKLTDKYEVAIECSNNCEGISEIDKCLKNNKSITSEIDTVIISSDDTSPPADGACLSVLISTLENINKDLVYLDDNLSFENAFNALRRIKVFHPANYKNISSDVTTSINIPIIAVYDFSGIEYLSCISSLTDIFRENGYNAIAVSDTCKGVIAGIEYIPFMNNESQDEFEHTTLSHFNRVFDPDIILLGINASIKKPDFLKRLEEKYDIDIRILLLPEDSDHMNDIIDQHTGCKTILFTSGVRNYYNAYESVDLSDKCCAEQLYDRIISLFEDVDRHKTIAASLAE